MFTMTTTVEGGHTGRRGGGGGGGVKALGSLPFPYRSQSKSYEQVALLKFVSVGACYRRCWEINNRVVKFRAG